MKKRIFATLLALVMALGLTVTAGAEFGEGWTELTAETGGTTLTGGNYYLSGDVEISSTITISGTVTLDLNGHVLKLKSSIYSGTASGSVIKVNSGTFTLQDTAGSTATHSFTKNETTGLYTLSDTGTITLTGGVITGGTGTATSDGHDTVYFGGGVYVGGNATFNMTGGNIVGCAIDRTGGGVYANDKSIFTMTGGSIVGCTAEYGGGVYADNGSIFTLNGGTIQYCTASYSGGGVLTNRAEFTMKSGSIVGCVANDKGGGVFIEKSGIFTMKAGSIDNCTASSNGGGVYVDRGTFTMESGSVVGCTATTNGGGVYIADPRYSTSTMDAQGGSVYGGVYIKNDTYCKLTNTSAAGSTIFYADNGNVIVKEKGDSGKGQITGKRVTFMKDGSLYAETVANENENGKISQPDAPTAEGEVFAGWYTEETGGDKWIFDTATVSDNMTLYARWGCAHTGDWKHDDSSHWKICATCGEKYAEAAHDDSHCTVCGYQKPSGTTTKPTTKPTTETVTSPKTTDPGVLLTGALSVASLLGMGYVSKKR